MLHPSLPPTRHPRTTTKYTECILLLQEPHQDIEWWWRGILHKSINGLFCYDAQKSRRIPYKYSPTPPHASLQSNATVAFDAAPNSFSSPSELATVTVRSQSHSCSA